jgi:hypothetical protein
MHVTKRRTNRLLCVFVYVRVYVCTSVRTCVRAYVCVYVCVYVCMCVCMCSVLSLSFSLSLSLSLSPSFPLTPVHHSCVPLFTTLCSLTEVWKTTEEGGFEGCAPSPEGRGWR